jgi:hypothetical protein
VNARAKMTMMCISLALARRHGVTSIVRAG